MLAQQYEGASQFGQWVAGEAWILLESRQLVYHITGSSAYRPFCPDSRRVPPQLPWSNAPPTECSEPAVDGLRELTEPCLLLLSRRQPRAPPESELTVIPMEGEFMPMRKR